LAENARINNPKIKNKENFPYSGKGQSRDIAASKVGFSGQSAKKAAEVVKVIEF